MLKMLDLLLITAAGWALRGLAYNHPDKETDGNVLTGHCGSCVLERSPILLLQSGKTASLTLL